jgi:hypothetical protein
MRDHELSTRDLAETTGPDKADQSLESPQNVGADESLSRDPVGEEAGEPLGSSSADVPAQDDRSVSAGHEPLLPSDQSDRFTSRWQEIQTSFVDQPRNAVAEADALVADLMQRLAASFSQERERLEGQWDRGDDVSTEDLRIALTRYRSFFDRLLAA